MKKTGKNRQRAVEGSSTVQQWLTWPWVFSLVLEVMALRAQESRTLSEQITGKCSKLCATDSLLKVHRVHLSCWLYLWNEVLIADVSKTTKQAQSGGLTLLTVTVCTFSLETVQILPEKAVKMTRQLWRRTSVRILYVSLLSAVLHTVDTAALQVAMTPKVSCFHNCLSSVASRNDSQGVVFP